MVNNGKKMVKNGKHFYGESVERLALFTMKPPPPSNHLDAAAGLYI